MKGVRAGSVGVGLVGVSGLLLTLGGVAAQAKTVEIRWADTDRNSKAVVQGIIKDFQVSNPGIAVKYENWVGWDYTRLITRITAAAAPDVIWCWGEGLLTLMDKGLTLDLTKYAKAYKMEKSFQEFHPAVMKSFRSKGQLMAVPKYTGTVGLYYNKSMFDKAGLPVPNNTWDWDSLVANGLKLVKKDAASGKITQFGLNVGQGGVPETWIWQNGGDVMPDNELVGSKLLIDSAKAMEAMRYRHSLTWKHHISPTSTEESPGGWEFFAKAKAAMWPGGSWDLDIVTKGLKDEWNIAELPKGPTGIRATMHTLDGYIIPANSKYKEAAFKFLAYLASPQGERARMKAQPLQPANLSLAKEWASTVPGMLKKDGLNLSAFTNGMEYARGGYFLRHWTVVKPVIDDYTDRMFGKNSMELSAGVAALVSYVNKRAGLK